MLVVTGPGKGGRYIGRLSCAGHTLDIAVFGFDTVQQYTPSFLVSYTLVRRGSTVQSDADHDEGCVEFHTAHTT